MSNYKLLTELLSSVYLLRSVDMPEAKNLYIQIRDNITPAVDEKKSTKKIHKNIYTPGMDDTENPFSSFEDGTVIVLPVIGMMTKYSSWWRYGMDEIASLIRAANNAPNISGIILLINTPGGTAQSVFQVEDALKNRIKPCVALIDGNCFSGGIYIASFCDKIFATNIMCETGSIGAMNLMVDDSKYWEKLGISKLEFYPPESEFKNLDIREALKGNPKMLIEENLSPFAKHFQEIIKSNRPNLNLQTEGIISGKTFYAYKAIEDNLIDGIKNLEETIEFVALLAKEQKDIYSQLNFN